MSIVSVAMRALGNPGAVDNARRSLAARQHEQQVAAALEQRVAPTAPEVAVPA